LRYIGLKPAQGLHLLDLPVELAAGECRQGMQQPGDQQIASADAAGDLFDHQLIGLQFRALIEHLFQVPAADAALTVELTEAFGGQIAMGSGKTLRLCQGLGEVQVLEAVQGIVVDEILDRGLSRQHMLQVFDELAQTLLEVGLVGLM
jgi:hypothetical protein